MLPQIFCSSSFLWVQMAQSKEASWAAVVQLTLKTPLVNGLKWLKNWRSKVSFKLQNLKKANPEEIDVRTETKVDIPPLSLSLSFFLTLPRPRPSKGPKARAVA